MLIIASIPTTLRRVLITALLVILTSVLPACETTVTSDSGRPMPPTPRAAPKTPDAAVPNALVLRHPTKAVDTNGNAFPDQIIIEIYLFAKPHPMPVHRAGMFTLALQRSDSRQPDAEALAQWTIDAERARQSRIRHPVWGAGYRFELSLLETGTDRYPPQMAYLTCRFIPSDETEGQPITSKGAHWLQIGADEISSARSRK